MMYQKGNFRNGYSKELEAEILELPYMGDDLMMTLILPSSRNGLSSVEHKLTYDIMSIMPTTLHNSSIDVYIPKFSLRCEYNLVEILTQMGMKDLFVSEVADLSGITGTRDLHISHVMHQAFIDVNENGSEAAAATAVVVNERSMTRRFRADHPFVFYITDKKTRSIIFLGRYVSPTVPATNAPRVDL
jgi:serpin B